MFWPLNSSSIRPDDVRSRLPGDRPRETTPTSNTIAISAPMPIASHFRFISRGLVLIGTTGFVETCGAASVETSDGEANVNVVAISR